MERPILFSAPMVRAILSGAKTQTRRAIRDQSMIAVMDGAVHLWTGFMGWQPFDAIQADPGLACKAAHCPYGGPGDRLYVRETWARDDEDGQLMYRADLGLGGNADDWERNRIEGAPRYRWRPSIHMPRAATRLMLEVTGVRLERLQDISEANAGAEGVLGWDYKRGVGRCDQPRSTNRDKFRQLWQSINGPGSWDANPWVWAIEFRRIDA